MYETKMYCDVCGKEIMDDDEYYGLCVRYNHGTEKNPFDYDNLVDIDLCGICYFKTTEKSVKEWVESYHNEI